MKIGIDAHVLGKNLGGVERFVAELINALPAKTPEHEYVVFVTQSAYKKLKAKSDAKVQYVPLAFAHPLLERLVLLPWLAYKYQLDALMVQRLAPWFCGRCQLVVAIHDLTPIKFADAYKGLSNTLVRLLTKNTIQRANLILTPTKAIKDEILTYSPNTSATIAHFYNGVDTSAFSKPSRHNSDGRYLLTVGAIERRKNIETIIKALPLLDDQKIKLRIMGGIRDQLYFDELMLLAQSLNLTDRIEYMGFVSESELVATYQNAALFVSASLDEGFNIPPLESMACGVTVVCSNIPVHLELFKDAAAFFDPTAVSELGAKINAMLDQPVLQQPLIEKGFEKVAYFTWEQTASNVALALKSL